VDRHRLRSACRMTRRGVRDARRRHVATVWRTQSDRRCRMTAPSRNAPTGPFRALHRPGRSASMEDPTAWLVFRQARPTLRCRRQADGPTQSPDTRLRLVRHPSGAARSRAASQGKNRKSQTADLCPPRPNMQISLPPARFHCPLPAVFLPAVGHSGRCVPATAQRQKRTLR